MECEIFIFHVTHRGLCASILRSFKSTFLQLWKALYGILEVYTSDLPKN
jgi:hypothetical protein